MYVNFKVFEMIEEEADKVDFELNAYGESIDLWNMK